MRSLHIETPQELGPGLRIDDAHTSVRPKRVSRRMVLPLHSQQKNRKWRRIIDAGEFSTFHEVIKMAIPYNTINYTELSEFKRR